MRDDAIVQQLLSDYLAKHDVHQKISTLHLAAVAHVSKNEGSTVLEIRDGLGVDGKTFRRLMSVIADKTPGGSGAGYVVLRRGRTKRDLKTLHLSKKGRDLAEFAESICPTNESLAA